MKTTTQHALMVITPIETEDDRKALEDLFKQMVDEDVEDNAWVPFKLLKTIHFARWFILPASTDVKGRPIPDQLVLSTNYDGPLDDHLAELVDVAGESGLDEIYKYCKGYPTHPTRENRIAYLREYQAKYNAFYVGTVGRTVGQIRQENELRDAIQVFLDDGDGWDAMAPADVRKAIQKFAFEKFDWAKTPPPPWLTPWIGFIKKNLIRILLALIVLIVVLLILKIIPFMGFLTVVGVLLVFVSLYAITLRYKEKHDQQFSMLGYTCPAEGLINSEDHILQNQLTVINNMKPGWFRLFTERFVQGAINFVARYIANEGNLGGIPSIHFARWCIIDKGRRLLFMSNFDGSWENYLGDFIDKAAPGLTAAWSSTVLVNKEDGFPNTKLLVLKGARDEQRFKAYSRAGQVTTNLWYSAYKELSVQNINNNSMVCAGLYGDPSPEEIVIWLHRF